MFHHQILWTLTGRSISKRAPQISYVYISLISISLLI
jgi:hypothetical protein